jgi:hypothetical protein
VIHLPDGPPLASLDSESAAWPVIVRKNNVLRAEGFDFKGYSLDKLRRPTFMYVTGAVKVSEFYEGAAAKDASSLKRTLTIEGAGDKLYARLATGTIETVEGGFKVNKDLTIKVTGDGKAIVRTVGGKQELVVPVKAGKATITAEYVW